MGRALLDKQSFTRGSSVSQRASLVNGRVKSVGSQNEMPLVLGKGRTGTAKMKRMVEEIDYCRDINEMVLCIQEEYP